MNEGKNRSDQGQEVAGWQYKPGDNRTPPQQSSVGAFDASQDAVPAAETIEWTASEFIAHDKGVSWYVFFMVATLVVAGIVYLISREIFSAIVVVILGILVAIAGSHKPRVITYRISRSGLSVGGKSYPFGVYKSFALIEEDPFASITLLPMKRFAFPLSIYLAPDTEQQVIEELSNHLPMERGGLDAMDQFMRSIRF